MLKQNCSCSPYFTVSLMHHFMAELSVCMVAFLGSQEVFFLWSV